MKVESNVLKQLAGTADILSTINGGTVYPIFTTVKEEDHYRLEVSVPTVDPERIKVEVSNNDLLVYQQIATDSITFPNLLGIINMTPDVMIEDISAEYEGDVLTVIMPFTEMPGGFHREIKIHRPI